MELLYKLFRSNFVLLTVDISNSRNYFLTSNIFGGITNNSSWSKDVIRSQMTLSINHCGYPALLYFALITLIPMSKFDAIFLDLCKYPEMVFRWYLFEKIFYKPKVQLSYFLFDMPLFKTTPSLFKMIFVFKNFSGFTSIVNFTF